MLAARPGEIVSKDALMQAVWPETFVTDDSLTQCIADIRRALGDDARDGGNRPKERLPTERRSIGRGGPKRRNRHGTCQDTIIAARLHSCCTRSPCGSDRRILRRGSMASRSRSFERHAQDCDPSLRRHECRCGQGISQRCRCRGDHHRAGAEQDLCRHRPELELQVPR
ncbi:winged helix-turn-helix domain-containing protein [Mesorhizobium sp. M0701]|uniref:winged helix-turn-helix domain-containing protein n=1 Tax=Mesorhizobium sp. M0701 TaxID=2956989 RepID=UPI00333D9BF6